MTDCSVIRNRQEVHDRNASPGTTGFRVFVAFLAGTEHTLEEDLVDQLSIRVRSASLRVLLLLAHFGKDGKPDV